MTTMTDQPPAPRRSSWIPIALVVIGVLALLGLAIVGSSLFWVSRHIRSQEVSSTAAAGALAEARAQFAGQTPAITLDDGRARITGEPAPGAAHAISALHVLAYNTDEGRLVRVDVPGWLLRLMARGDVRIDDVDGLSEVRGRIRLEDLQRRGPGLVLDTTTPDGSQVVIWTE